MFQWTIPFCTMVLGLGFAVSATAAVPAEQTANREKITVIGAYSSDLESEDFFPCDREERWRVTDESGLNREYASLVPEDGQPFFVQASGYVTPPGRYGQMGYHNRAIVITDYTVTLIPPRDCVLYER